MYRPTDHRKCMSPYSILRNQSITQPYTAKNSINPTSISRPATPDQGTRLLLKSTRAMRRGGSMSRLPTRLFLLSSIDNSGRPKDPSPNTKMNIPQQKAQSTPTPTSQAQITTNRSTATPKNKDYKKIPSTRSYSSSGTREWKASISL